MTDTSIRVTRKVGAAAAVVFDLLANPDRHHEIDASGMVGDDEDASPITKVGQVFRMNMISVNGSAARHAAVGDLIIIASFAHVHEDQVLTHKPQLIFVDEANRQMGARQQVPTQQR